MSVIKEGHKFLSAEVFYILALLVEQEGEFVGGYAMKEGTPVGDKSWSQGMVCDDEWDERFEDASPAEVIAHAIAYHRDNPSHGEQLGLTICAYEAWKDMPGARDLEACLARTIVHAWEEGVDH